MDGVFSSRWFGHVALFTAIILMTSLAISRVGSRRSVGRAPMPAQEPAAKRLMASIGAVIFGQAAVAALVRLLLGPLSSDTWAFFIAMSLGAVGSELLKTRPSRHG